MSNRRHTENGRSARRAQRDAERARAAEPGFRWAVRSRAGAAVYLLLLRDDQAPDEGISIGGAYSTHELAEKATGRLLLPLSYYVLGPLVLDQDAFPTVDPGGVVQLVEEARDREQ